MRSVALRGAVRSNAMRSIALRGAVRSNAMHSVALRAALHVRAPLIHVETRVTLIVEKDGPGPVMVSSTLCPAVHILGT